ncbi:MAG: hypothetical protein ACKOUR_06455, partial [Planctomycetota bacterium]
GMAKVFHVLARDRDGMYSTSLVREFADDTKKELLSREISSKPAGWSARCWPQWPPHPQPFLPHRKKKVACLASATITLFSCGGEGSSQRKKRESQKETPLKGWAYALAATRSRASA